MLPSINGNNVSSSESQNRYRGESIIFHSRSVYLRSRHGQRKHESQDNKLPPILRERNKSGTDRLLPPSQLQTKYKAQRYSFGTHEARKNVKALHGLMKQEDLAFVKRKTELMERIQASELMNKRGKQQPKQYNDQVDRARSPLHLNLNSSDVECTENDVGRRSSLLRQQLKDRRKSSLIASMVFSSKSSNSRADDERYPEAFSFLEDWKNDVSHRML